MKKDITYYISFFVDKFLQKCTNEFCGFFMAGFTNGGSCFVGMHKCVYNELPSAWIKIKDFMNWAFRLMNCTNVHYGRNLRFHNLIENCRAIFYQNEIRRISIHGAQREFMAIANSWQHRCQFIAVRINAYPTMFLCVLPHHFPSFCTVLSLVYRKMIFM